MNLTVRWADHTAMHKAVSIFFQLIAPALLATIMSSASAAPLEPSSEDRYIVARDEAIKKFSALYDTGKFDETADKAEAATRADLKSQMQAILNEPPREGFAPAEVNLETFYTGDEGFGMLDGLRFDALLGISGEKAGGKGADGEYVQPKGHIIVTTQTLFERWLHDHKDWWRKELKNVPQQIGAALADESFYTQAISSGSAVINFSALPIARPPGATMVRAILAGRSQSEVPETADVVFVSALANGKVYIAYRVIEPKVKAAACHTLHADYSEKGEKAFKRCFTQHAPQEPAFAAATKQAEALLATALGM